MEKMNIFDLELVPEFFFTSFPADKEQEYRLIVYNFNSPDIKTLCKYKNGNAQQYYVWKCKAEQDYLKIAMPKDVTLTLHFPKKSLDHALGIYLADKMIQWRKDKQRFYDTDCTAIFRFIRVSNKEIKITYLKLIGND